MGVTVRKKGKGKEWWIFVAHNGKRTSQKVGTDKTVATKLAKVIEGQLAAQNLGVFDDKEAVKTVMEYATIWLATTVPVTLKASTQDDYRSIVKTHITKAPFAKTPVDKITVGDVKRFLRSKLQAGLALSTVQHIKNALSGVFKEAIADNIIQSNPAQIKDWAPKSGSKKPKTIPLEIDEVGLLLDIFKAKSPQYHPLVMILIHCGLRIGEACALKWSDIDLEEREINVNRNYVRMRIEDSTKNGKTRRVDISSQLEKCLRSLKQQRSAEALKKGSGSISDHWVFSAVTNPRQPLDYQNWRRRVFNPLLEHAGLRRVRVHDLRHTYASLMIHADCNIVYIKEQLGHSSITTTIDTYGHLLKGNAEKPVDALSKLLHPSAPHLHPEAKKGISI